MNRRTYRSQRRAATAADTGERIVATAAALLGAQEGIRGFSLEAVAKAAGVTRLTVYNQFGSRRALLEAVFDDRAARGGMRRVMEAATDPDPRAGLRRLIAVFCEFWSFDREAIDRLHAAGASDPEFDEALRARNERRRGALRSLVDRMIRDAPARVQKLDDETTADLVDVLFALTSFAFFANLTAGGRPAVLACGLIQSLAADAVARARL